MAKEKLESQIVAEILNFLSSIRGCFAMKMHGGPYGRGGMPDISGCFMGYRFDIEVKRPGKVATPRQLAMMNKIAEAGGTVFVAHSAAEVKTALGDDLRHLIYPGLQSDGARSLVSGRGRGDS